jgi:hypothetical protein
MKGGHAAVSGPLSSDDAAVLSNGHSDPPIVRHVLTRLRCENHDVEIGVHPSGAASPGADNCGGDDVILPHCPLGKEAAQLHELLESVLREHVLKSGHRRRVWWRTLRRAGG